MRDIVETCWVLKKKDCDYFVSSNDDINVANPTIALKFSTKKEAIRYGESFVKNFNDYEPICIRIKIYQIHRA